MFFFVVSMAMLLSNSTLGTLHAYIVLRQYTISLDTVGMPQFFDPTDSFRRRISCHLGQFQDRR